MNTITRYRGTRGSLPGRLPRHALARRSAGAAALMAAGLALLVPSAAGAAATAGASQAGPAKPPPLEYQFQSVSCPTTRMCAAVGGVNTGGPAFAEVWSAGKWSITPVPLPAGATGGALAGVSCTAADACTAVGDYGSSTGGGPLAERWDGHQWSVQPTPSPGGGGIPFAAVSCASATSCTAVGHFDFDDIGFTYGTLVEHWDGTSWAIQSTPPVGNPGSDLTWVSCPSASVCVAAGYQLGQSDEGPGSGTLAMRWQGTNWVIQNTPGANDGTGNVTAGLAGISCSSASACTAVGEGPDGNPLVVRWNGTLWSSQHVRGDASLPSMNGVSCPSATVCTAVGGSGGAGLADRWNGRIWSVQQLRVPSGAAGIVPNSVSCPTALRCTAVGYSDSSRGALALAEHWNGRRWSLQTAPIPSAAPAR